MPAKKRAPRSNSAPIILAYIPVLHEGYRRFFENHPEAKELFILGKDVTNQYRPLVKDIRALDPELIKSSLEAWQRFDSIRVADETVLKSLRSSRQAIIMPDEGVMRELKEKYFPSSRVKFDTIFLRWDKHKAFENNPVEADQTVSTSSKDQKMMELLKEEAEKSSDNWRHIGAAVVKGNKILSVVHNHAVPSEHLPYDEGDPRSDFHKGVAIEYSTAFHCEAQLIAEAAEKGVSLKGASMYVTTFPCPACAKLVAYSGIKDLYYADGYDALDGVRILKSKDVKIIHVKMNARTKNGDAHASPWVEPDTK
ncbi:MAG: deoxycytidylate deaminase [Patescibacteria group bacterium]|nr:deoxycytidylate deaminase [Patescibacteria group bacterium]MDE1940826.1 deoxycytidylate deaminase [Patescibacteria group bacterium]MDE1966736.1 deoxycytidylate deaminase [Patescibacteria group bacterium]